MLQIQVANDIGFGPKSPVAFFFGHSREVSDDYRKVYGICVS